MELPGRIFNDYAKYISSGEKMDGMQKQMWNFSRRWELLLKKGEVGRGVWKVKWISRQRRLLNRGVICVYFLCNSLVPPIVYVWFIIVSYEKTKSNKK